MLLRSVPIDLDQGRVRAGHGDLPPARHVALATTVRKADAVIIAPATYNSVNKLAAGIADNYALTVVAELVGLGLPTVVVPFVNAALASRAPYRNALRALESEGVRILGSGDQWEPHEPGTGSQRQRRFPWQRAFDVAATLAARAEAAGS